MAYMEKHTESLVFSAFQCVFYGVVDYILRSITRFIRNPIGRGGFSHTISLSSKRILRWFDTISQFRQTTVQWLTIFGNARCNIFYRESSLINDGLFFVIFRIRCCLYLQFCLIESIYAVVYTEYSAVSLNSILLSNRSLWISYFVNTLLSFDFNLFYF